MLCKIMPISRYEHYPVALFMSGIKQEKEESVLEYCDRLEEELKDIYEESGQQEKYIRFHAILMETQAQYCIPQGYYRRGIECIEKALKSIGCIGEDAKEKSLFTISDLLSSEYLGNRKLEAL